MGTAIRDADHPAWSGCICCGRVDADSYVPVGERQFLCYRCVDWLHKTRRRNARLVRRMSVRQRAEVAFAHRDMTAFGGLVADNARWGDDDASNRCRSRADVLSTFDRLLREGVQGRVDKTTTGPRGVMLRLHVDWPNPVDRSRGESFYHVYVVRDGKIAEIKRFDDRASAIDALAG